MNTSDTGFIAEAFLEECQRSLEPLQSIIQQVYKRCLSSLDQTNPQHPGPPKMSDATFLGGSRTKAGLPEAGGLDRQRIDEIIREASKGSKYYQYQQRHEAKIMERIKILALKKASLEKSFEKDDSLYRKTLYELDRWHKELEAKRDLTKTFAHIDMDGSLHFCDLKLDLFSFLCCSRNA